MNNLLDTLITLEDTAAYICTKLKENGIDVVLSGGSCMEIYTHKNFSSYDIDFIANPSYTAKKISEVMLSIGFNKVDGRYYKYENNPNYIEFPTGPVSLGNEFPKKFDELKTLVGTLVLLTPTDCIKDRLCAYVYHGGNECFQQAMAVAHLNEIDINNLKKWAKNESKEMKMIVDTLLLDLKLLQKIDITTNDIQNYLKHKAKNLFLNLSNANDLETIKDDLFGDYVFRQLLNIKNDSEYYNKVNIFLNNDEKDI